MVSRYVPVSADTGRWKTNAVVFGHYSILQGKTRVHEFKKITFFILKFVGFADAALLQLFWEIEYTDTNLENRLSMVTRKDENDAYVSENDEAGTR